MYYRAVESNTLFKTSSQDHSNTAPTNTSDVKYSRTSWPRGQNFVHSFGLGLEELSSASSICPRHVLELFILAS